VKSFKFILPFIVAVFLAGPWGAAYAAEGPAFISWVPPTTNVDGTAYTDAGGYILESRLPGGNWTEIADIGASETELNITQSYPDGGDVTIEYRMLAYDTSGNRGGWSNIATKTFGDTNPPETFDIQVSFNTHTGQFEMRILIDGHPVADISNSSEPIALAALTIDR